MNKIILFAVLSVWLLCDVSQSQAQQIPAEGSAVQGSGVLSARVPPHSASNTNPTPPVTGQRRIPRVPPNFNNVNAPTPQQMQNAPPPKVVGNKRSNSRSSGGSGSKGSKGASKGNLKNLY
jgi:hypothetical protein